MATDFLSDLASTPSQGSAAPTSGGSDFLSDLATAPAAPANNSAPTPADSPYKLGPWASSVVRPIAGAIAAPVMLPADVGITIGNAIRNPIERTLGLKQTPNYPLMSETLDQLLSKYTTLPEGWGKGAELASTALLSSRIPMPTGAASVPSNFVAPGTSELTGAQQSAKAAGAQLGMKLTPGQSTGSKTLQQLEAKLESQPWSSGPFNAIKSNNQGILDKTAASTIGEDAPTVDASVLGKANDRLGDVFESVRNVGRTTPSDPQKTSQVLHAIDEDTKGLLPNNASILDHPLVKTLQDTLDTQSDISGKQLGSISSKLGKSAFKEMSSSGGDRDLGQALYSVKDHVDDLVQSTLSPSEAQDYIQARQQYRTLMQLTNRLGVVNPSTGHVSGPVLANALRQSDKPGFLYGKNQSPLYQAARFAQAFRPLVGDSGTATRSNLLPYIGGSLVGGGVGAAAPGNHLKNGAIGALLGLGGLNAATRLYLSRPGAALAGGAANLASSPESLGRPAIYGLLTAKASEASQ